MNASLLKTTLAIVLSAASVSVFASTYSGTCTNEPKSKWMAEKDVQAKFEQQGYTVRRVKTGGSCYEVYAKDKDGKKTELFVNPVNGTLVQEAGKS